jgi:UDP-N-acetylmuramate--alanine ligase
MLTHILVAAGRNPSWLCGQPIRGIGANGHFAGSDLVLETDESFGSFRLLRPRGLGILNIEPDHLDYYGTVDAMEQAYVDLALRTTGPVVVRTRHAAELIRAVRPDALEIGDAHDSDAAVTMQSDGSRLLLRGAVDLNLVLAVHGAHNHENAAVAAVLAACQGIDSGAIEAGLRRFHGAPRRFELRGGLPGRVVIDDYAHLPSEIATTIAAARDLTRGCVIVLFQPHRVSRTQNLGATFGPAFRGADEVVVSAIYDAGEPNPQHITSEIIANSIDESGVPVRYIPDMNEASRAVRTTARCGDVVLVVGAGDIGTVIRSWEVGA